MGTRDALLSDNTTKPASEPVAVDNIPEELREHRRWMLWSWRWCDKSKRWTKTPKRRSGGNGSSTDADSWCTFDEAVESYQNDGRFDGIGFALGDPFVGVDLDECIVGGRILDEHEEIIGTLGGYWEVSPTGTGVKSIAKGVKPKGRSKTPKDHFPEVEMYGSGRFFTITGHTLPQSEEDFDDKTEAIAEIYTQYIANPGGGGVLFEDNPELELPSEAKVYDPDDIELAKECLANISPDMSDDRDTWIKIGIAAKSISPKLWKAWDDFSKQSPKYKAADAKSRWMGFQPRGECGLGTLIHYAQESGWERPDDSLADIEAQAALIEAESGPEERLRSRIAAFLRNMNDVESDSSVASARSLSEVWAAEQSVGVEESKRIFTDILRSERTRRASIGDGNNLSFARPAEDQVNALEMPSAKRAPESLMFKRIEIVDGDPSTARVYSDAFVRAWKNRVEMPIADLLSLKSFEVQVLKQAKCALPSELYRKGAWVKTYRDFMVRAYVVKPDVYANRPSQIAEAVDGLVRNCSRVPMDDIKSVGIYGTGITGVDPTGYAMHLPTLVRYLREVSRPVESITQAEVVRLIQSCGGTTTRTKSWRFWMFSEDGIEKLRESYLEDE